MNYFIQGDSNMYRVNLNNEHELANKTLSISQIFIKLKTPSLDIRYAFINNDNIIQPVHQFRIPNDDIWLSYKHEPFTFDREAKDSNIMTLSIKDLHVPNNLRSTHFAYWINDQRVKIPIANLNGQEFAYYHNLYNTKLFKVYFEFDQVQFNTMEFKNKALDKRLTYLVASHIMSEDSLNIFPDILDPNILTQSFYFVVKDENDTNIDIDYFLISFNIN